MKTKTVSGLICIMMLINLIIVPAVSANSLTASFKPSDGKVTLRGEATGVVTVRVIKDGIPTSSLSADNMPSDFHQLTANGLFTYEFFMPLSATTGKYNINITDKTGESIASILYFDYTAASSIVALLKNTTSLSDFLQIYKANEVALGIDVDDSDYKAVETAVQSILYSEKASFLDGIDFYEKTKKAIVIASLSISDVTEVLRKYSTYLGIDFQNDFEGDASLTDKSKEILINILSKMNYSSAKNETKLIVGADSFADVYKTSKLLALLQAAEGWHDIREIYEDISNDVLGNILKNNISFKSLSSSSVYTRMAELGFTEISDLKDTFNDAVAYVDKYSKQQTPTAGGGARGSTVTVSPLTEKAPYEETVSNDDSDSEQVKFKLPQLENSEATFYDMAPDHWASTAVGALAAKGIVKGYNDGTFLPSSSITRAEFANLVVSAFDIKSPKANFEDVDESAWYYDAVTIAAGSGIVSGYDGKFNSNDNITRQDAAVIIYRAAKMYGVTYKGLKDFKDFNDIALYAWTAVGSLAYNNIINGMGDSSFRPYDNITRAQAAQILYNLINDLGKTV